MDAEVAGLHPGTRGGRFASEGGFRDNPGPRAWSTSAESVLRSHNNMNLCRSAFHTHARIQ